MAPRPPREEPPVEASPLWGVLLTLAEIAERVARRRAEERRAPDGEPNDRDGDDQDNDPRRR